jgi:hypothetical protein
MKSLLLCSLLPCVAFAEGEPILTRGHLEALLENMEQNLSGKIGEFTFECTMITILK